jgi:hypoxanthine phosphoribosyltransferase
MVVSYDVPKGKKAIKFSWSDFDRAVDQIVWQLTAGNKLDQFGQIWGIPRGGLILAVALSHRLDKPLVSDIDQLSIPANHRRFLVVDEICDTGKTLEPFSNLLTATIHYNPKACYRPIIWVYPKSEEDWIIYPWEIK